MLKNDITLSRGADDSVTFEPAVSGTKELNNPMLAKTGRMKWNEGYIEYTVNINPQGVSLPENFVLTDRFSPTLQLDSESVKLTAPQ